MQINTKYEQRLQAINKVPLSLEQYLQTSLDSDPPEELCRGWDYLKTHIIPELLPVITSPDYLSITYNSSNTEHILKALPIDNISNEMKRQLESFVYLYKDIKRKADKEEYAEEMQKQGWTPLSEEIVKQAAAEGKKILLKGVATNDWLTVDMSNTYKPFVSSNENCMLMKLKARSRGYSLRQFENAFCKIV